jgi:hypothetical protein
LAITGGALWPCFQGSIHGNLFPAFLGMLPNGITAARGQLHVQYPSCGGLLFLQGNSTQAPPSSSLVAHHRCNLMGTEFVPEARVISHN